MGDLNIHNLSLFNCTVFIETGTGKGAGIKYALRYAFEKLYTIEIMKELYEYSKKRIKDNRAKLIHDNSIDGLKKILPECNKSDKILFWLDAHFPGVDFGLVERVYKYDDENMPLKKELDIINKYREGCADSFIIDDLRFYEDGEYELGNLDIGKPKSGIGFIEELYGKTHNIVRNYRHQGFLILCPLK